MQEYAPPTKMLPAHHGIYQHTVSALRMWLEVAGSILAPPANFDLAACMAAQPLQCTRAALVVICRCSTINAKAGRPDQQV